MHIICIPIHLCLVWFFHQHFIISILPVFHYLGLIYLNVFSWCSQVWDYLLDFIVRHVAILETIEIISFFNVDFLYPEISELLFINGCLLNIEKCRV